MEQTRRLSSEPTQLLPTKPWQTCEQYTLDYTEPVQHETLGLREEDTSKHRDMDNDLLNRTPGAWEMTLRPELTDGIAWMKILLHSKGKIHPEAGFFFYFSLNVSSSNPLSVFLTALFKSLLMHMEATCGAVAEKGCLFLPIYPPHFIFTQLRTYFC